MFACSHPTTRPSHLERAPFGPEPAQYLQSAVSSSESGIATAPSDPQLLPPRNRTLSSLDKDLGTFAPPYVPRARIAICACGATGAWGFAGCCLVLRWELESGTVSRKGVCGLRVVCLWTRRYSTHSTDFDDWVRRVSATRASSEGPLRLSEKVSGEYLFFLLGYATWRARWIRAAHLLREAKREEGRILVLAR